MDKKISYIFPSRERYQKFFKCLDNIVNLSDSDNFEIIVAFDSNDPIMNNEFVKMKMMSYKNVSYYYGVSNSKVDAINRECLRATGDIICLHSDDFLYTVKGFDTVIREEMKGFEGLLHLPDGFPDRAKDRLITYPIMSRGYFNRFKYIYFPEYHTSQCDEEQQMVAKKLGMYKFVDRQIFVHNHFRTGFEPPDALNLRNESARFYMPDKVLYLKRKEINFGL